MPREKIRVGVIGASPRNGWASISHVPALRALPQFDISAVATTRAQTAAEAARQAGANHAFTDGEALIRHADVDLVVVAVKAPDHAPLIRAAAAAGKAVLSEWPLARTSAEAESLLQAARAAGISHAVGLQARHAPAVEQARALVADGYIGRVTSVNVYSLLDHGAGGVVHRRQAYSLNRANGVTVLSVVGGHTLDAVEHILADRLIDVAATLTVQHPQLAVAETAEPLDNETADHVAISGVFAAGAAFVAHLHRGKRFGARTLIEISGTDGDLTLSSHGPGNHPGIQMAQLRLHGTRVGDRAQREFTLPVTSLPQEVRSQPALNVARLYQRLDEATSSGGRAVATFDDAHRLHQLLDTIELAARSRRTQAVASPLADAVPC